MAPLRQAALFLLTAIAAVSAADPPVANGWKFDVIRTKNGTVFRGLILNESATAIRFENVRQQPGRPTFLLTTTFSRAEIDRVERLDAAEREQLKARLQELAEAGQEEKQREERLELESAPWDGKPDGGRRYRSDLFTLDSDATEVVVRRAAVRLEQIYAAYARFLPPRGPGRGPTAVFLVKSREEYRSILRARHLSLAGTAFFNAAANRVYCASDLDQIGADLEAVRERHQQIAADLDQREAVLVKLYKGKELARHVDPIRETRRRIARKDKENEALFDRATQDLFATLYHEAFHAYLANCVYPPGGAEAPRWLNEGLAQIFETAIVEAGELRIGHADRVRLARAKEAVRAGEFLPLVELLRAEPARFLAAHAAERAWADKLYLASWALAYHVTFERRLLGSPALDHYFGTLREGADPLDAFQALVGEPLPQFEQDFRRYLLRLQPDGSTDDTLPAKP
jgi:hypothetical protein